MLKQVKVEFISEGWSPPGEIYQEDGFINGVDDLVMTIDDIGGTDVYKLAEMKDSELAIAIGNGLMEDNPRIIIDFINNGGGVK